MFPSTKGRVAAEIQSATEPPPAWCKRVLIGGWICVGLGAATFWWFGVGFGLLLAGMICGIVASRVRCRRKGMSLFWAALATIAVAVMLLLYLLSGSEVGPADRHDIESNSATRLPPNAR